MCCGSNRSLTLFGSQPHSAFEPFPFLAARVRAHRRFAARLNRLRVAAEKVRFFGAASDVDEVVLDGALRACLAPDVASCVSAALFS